MIYSYNRIPLLCFFAVYAQTQLLPYTPASLLQGQNSTIYFLDPASKPQFSSFNISGNLNASTTPTPISTTLPFTVNATNTYTSIVNSDAITVLTGQCGSGEQELGLWQYGTGEHTKSWSSLHTTLDDRSLTSNFLSAAFIYSPTNSSRDDQIYLFGGMCPRENMENASSWISDATYSNTLVSITSENNDTYELSLTGQRAPPIPEAGLSITALASAGTVAEKQENFVLIGGHTANAFINMSQVALYSLPEQSWAFLDVSQSAEIVIEPRSGHTAILSEDQTKIFVLGGWVGDITNAATPSLAVLNIGQGYGGYGSWSWSAPPQNSSLFSNGNSMYGHAAIMLPGDVMMVMGGFSISNSTSSKRKRDTHQIMFFNTTSNMWISEYVNPQKISELNKSALSSGQKIGVGVGVGVGLALFIVLVIVGLMFTRRLRQSRHAKQKELRQMAMGSSRADVRSASWNNRSEKLTGSDLPWPLPEATSLDTDRYHNDGPYAVTRSGTMLDVPSPTRGLRRSLSGRGPAGLGVGAVYGASTISRIDEEEEHSQRGSIRRSEAPERPGSNPFRDSPESFRRPGTAEDRRRELAGWVDDWQHAGESMNTSEATSKAHSRTNSNISGLHSREGRISPDKSDRTGSNLSEKSDRSNLSSGRSATGTVSRQMSQRSNNTGHALFTGATSVIGKLAGRQPDLTRSESKRSISTGDLAQLGARRRTGSMSHDASETSKLTNVATNDSAAPSYYTPPESPIKDFKHSRNRSTSLTDQSKKALGVLRTATKRVLTGTNSVDVAQKVDVIEHMEHGTSARSSPTKERLISPMADITPRRTSSTGAAFWKRKQGAQDWDDGIERSGTVRRRSARYRDDESSDDHRHGVDNNGDEWDVETAVQQRVVQVMFTVPKEKLRVVNADETSMISRSDTQLSKNSDVDVDELSSEATTKLANRPVSVSNTEPEVSDNTTDGPDEGMAHTGFGAYHLTTVGYPREADIAEIMRYGPNAYTGWKGKDKMVETRVSQDTVRTTGTQGTIGKAF